ncbi:uncharacterized protein LOC135498737 [Lineus longissimus]|uniref:uncharacterized protein LOC135498737 n=1 Tax=Lineus longissimus TaxID=88925 RepID=UPI002B4E777A
MPISRVPILHKFGIISHSQRLELQERLLKQSYLQAVGTKPAASQARNPIEVTDEFINQYNSSRSFDEKEKLEELAHKMLERIKRRAGLRDGGKGGHVDLPIAWTELSQLAQCKGVIQEDCLDVLISSLDQAPLAKAHIPALFYLAETCLYWLRTDAVNQPYLRTGEIKLLKMGQLVFTRLFYHHMAGQLQGQNDFKGRLFTYLDGFAECQEAYNPYPNALLSLRYINEVGKIVIGDANIEPGEIKEGDALDKQSLIESLHSSKERRSSTKNSTSVNTAKDQFREVSANYEPTTAQTSKSGALSSSVHDLSPTLWHTLDVWRCSNSLGGGLDEAVYAMSQCGKGMAQENWVDAMCALSVLAEAAKTNLYVLKAMQNLARGMKLQSPKPSLPRQQSTHYETITTGYTEENISVCSDVSVASQTSHQSLSDIYERTEEDTNSVKDSLTSERAVSGKSQKSGSQKSRELSVTSEAQADIGLESVEKFVEETKEGAVRADDNKLLAPDGNLGSRSKEVSFDVNLTDGEKDISSKQGDQLGEIGNVGSGKIEGQGSVYDGLPGTGLNAEAGTDLPSGRVSQASSVPTYTNTPFPNIYGLHGWHWEVGISYTELMADIVLHGKTSNLQKRALVGNNTEYDGIHKRETFKHPMKSAGLLDLVNFKAAKESDDNSPNDWSWRIRYTALQGLVKICRCCAGDKNKDGIRTVAWTALMRAQSVEVDDRVLEALKVGQVDANIENLISKHLTVTQSAIGAKIAAALAKMYLPPLPPPVETKSTTPQRVRPKLSTQTPSTKAQQKKQPLRTTLKEELMLASVNQERPADYNTRTGFDLKRMVEDQWRKELQSHLEEEEKDRIKGLALEQKADEEAARQREIKKMEKLKGKASRVPVT